MSRGCGGIIAAGLPSNSSPALRGAPPHDGSREPAAARAVTGAALLEANVLVALFDPDHVHHEAAHVWFGRHRNGRLATFDRSIPLSAIVGAEPAHLESIPA